MTGHCKFFDSDRGFGFIQPDDNSPDIFVHCSQLLTGRNHLRALDRVQFEIGISPRNGKRTRSTFALSANREFGRETIRL
jgi:cold shock protein